MTNFLIQGQITRTVLVRLSSIIKLIRDLMVIYILTKFGADWSIFVDAKVLTRKLWTDGHRRTVSDHNSSLSTSCSGELIKEYARKIYIEPVLAPKMHIKTFIYMPFLGSSNSAIHKDMMSKILTNGDEIF